MRQWKYTPQSVVGRTLAILNSFDAKRPGLTLSEISRSSGLPMSTTFRLVTQLLEWGALTRTDDRRYWIGPKLVERRLLADQLATGQDGPIGAARLHELLGELLPINPSRHSLDL